MQTLVRIQALLAKATLGRLFADQDLPTFTTQWKTEAPISNFQTKNEIKLFSA